MYAGTHPKAKQAREIRIYNAKRRENERIRRTADAVARVHRAGTLAAH